MLVAEEHNVSAGSASAVAEALVDARRPGAALAARDPRDEYSLIAPPTHLYRHYRLDAEGVTDAARQLLREPADRGGADR